MFSHQNGKCGGGTRKLRGKDGKGQGTAREQSLSAKTEKSAKRLRIIALQTKKN